MNTEKDTYKTIAKAAPEVLFKEKGSKFYGFAFPIQSEEDVKPLLENLRKKHYNARHWCYAWQLGKNYDIYRANDDGEPSNSAGMPIYGQLQSFDLTHVLVVVVRYFGGTKLGVGGLVQAYKTTAQLAIEGSKIVERTIDEDFLLLFEYAEMNTVMRVLKDENLEIKNQKIGLNCEIKIAVRKKDAEKIYSIFEQIHKVEIKRIEK